MNDIKVYKLRAEYAEKQLDDLKAKNKQLQHDNDLLLRTVDVVPAGITVRSTTLERQQKDQIDRLFETVAMLRKKLGNRDSILGLEEEVNELNRRFNRLQQMYNNTGNDTEKLKLIKEMNMIRKERNKLRNQIYRMQGIDTRICVACDTNGAKLMEETNEENIFCNKDCQLKSISFSFYYVLCPN